MFPSTPITYMETDNDLDIKEKTRNIGKLFKNILKIGRGKIIISLTVPLANLPLPLKHKGTKKRKA